MERHTDAQLFLADQRGRSDSDLTSRNLTFNAGTYLAPGREPFGPLTQVADDALRAGAILTFTADRPTNVVLIPVTGGLEYQTGADESAFLLPGQVGILSLATGDGYVVRNPYETETINALQLWLSLGPGTLPGEVRQVGVDLGRENELLSIFQSVDHQLFMGQYAGREEGVYQLTDAARKGVFVFVVAGVFEVTNRLLHARDGLTLRYDEDTGIEFEALSNGAILLVIEVGL